MPEIVLIPEVGDIVAGKYRIEKRLGSGGMGTVFAARHTSTHRLFALKLLSASLSEDDEARVRFVREAKLAGAIDHPAVVRIYDIGYHGASLYMVMDLLVGESLSDRLKRGPLPVADAIRIMKGILEGVGAAHKKGIVHRDLKPENIFLCRTSEHGFPEPRILDFGVSKALVGSEASVLALTKTGEILGTPLYMSPEQVQGAKDIDQRADIYALGVILYQMLSGETPFKAETFPGLIFEIISGEAKPLSQTTPGISAELNDVVMTAIALSQNDRFASVERLSQAIGPFGEGNAEQPVDYSKATESRRSSIPDTPTPFKTEIETTVRTPSFFNKRSYIAIAAYLAVAIAIVGTVAFYALGLRRAASPSGVMQTAQPPQSPKATQIVSQPLTSAAPKSTSQIQSKTKAPEIENSLPIGMTAPKGESEYLSRSDRRKHRRPVAETSNKPVREAKPKQVYPREYVPVEKKPEPKPPTKSNDFEIDDDQIIDPFED
jgi:serine/threonine protein kinase